MSGQGKKRQGRRRAAGVPREVRQQRVQSELIRIARKGPNKEIRAAARSVIDSLEADRDPGSEPLAKLLLFMIERPKPMRQRRAKHPPAPSPRVREVAVEPEKPQDGESQSTESVADRIARSLGAEGRRGRIVTDEHGRRTLRLGEED